MSFSWESLKANGVALRRLYEAAFEWGESSENPIPEYMERFMVCINDDLNMPRALAVAWDLIKADAPTADKKATLLAFDVIFGLDIADWKPEVIEVPDAVLVMAEARETARQNKEWARADELRDEALAAGYVIEDTREGPRVKKA